MVRDSKGRHGLAQLVASALLKRAASSSIFIACS
jgi:hypothetical protein